MRSQFTLVFVFNTISCIKVVAIVTGTHETAGSVETIGIDAATMYAKFAFINLVT